MIGLFRIIGGSEGAIEGSGCWGPCGRRKRMERGEDWLCFAVLAGLSEPGVRSSGMASRSTHRPCGRRETQAGGNTRAGRQRAVCACSHQPSWSSAIPGRPLCQGDTRLSSYGLFWWFLGVLAVFGDALAGSQCVQHSPAIARGASPGAPGWRIVRQRFGVRMQPLLIVGELPREAFWGR